MAWWAARRPTRPPAPTSRFQLLGGRALLGLLGHVLLGGRLPVGLALAGGDPHDDGHDPDHQREPEHHEDWCAPRLARGPQVFVDVGRRRHGHGPGVHGRRGTWGLGHDRVGVWVPGDRHRLRPLDCDQRDGPRHRLGGRRGHVERQHPHARDPERRARALDGGQHLARRRPAIPPGACASRGR